MKTEINGQSAELLFYNNWMYNVVRIQNELKRIFENEGGEMVQRDRYQKPLQLPSTPTYVVNRTLKEQIKQLEEKVSYLETRPIKCVESYLDYKNKLERLQQIPNEPILKTGAHDFVLNDMYYGILFDDNMFFATYYAVAHVSHSGKNRIVTYDYFRKMTTEWKYECLYQYDCSAADIREVAYQIFNMLINHKAFPKRGSSAYLHTVTI